MHRLLLQLVALALTLIASPRAWANGVAMERWWTIETDHFRVHYHDGVAELGPEVALMCEQAHALLAPRFAYDRPGRTEVVLRDGVDTANGSAGVVPKNHMTLYAMAPEADSVLGDYDNWMWGLIVHEYTHVLHIDTMGRLFRVLNWPFGKQLAPNQLLPRWFIEGLATYNESAYTGGGRVRSRFFQMQLRAAALEGEIPALGELSGVPLPWPRATGWYLYGAFFVDYLVRTYGWEPMYRFVERYGNRVVPFGINVLAEDCWGADMATLWDDWRAEVEAEALALALGVELAGPTEVRDVTAEGYRNRYVATVGHGDPVWIRNDGQSPPALVLGEGDAAQQWLVRGTNDFAMIPGQDAAILSITGATDEHYIFGDLWRFDLETEDLTALTYGARAREPAVSPDGSEVAFVRPTIGRTDLMRLDLETLEVTTLLEAVPWGQAGQPTYLADGRVVFSYMRPGEGRNLYVIDADGDGLTQLTHGRAMDLDPATTPDGAHVLFTSDRSGAYNIHMLRLADGEVRQITQVKTGVFSPAWGALDGQPTLYVSHYDASGFDVGAVTLGQDPFAAGIAASAGYERPSLAPPLLEDVWIGAPHRYHTVVEARPRTWRLRLAATAESSALGVELGGSDWGGKMGYALAAQWTNDPEDWSGALSLSLHTLTPTVGLNLARVTYPQTRSLVGESRWIPYREERLTAGLWSSWVLTNAIASHQVSTDYLIDHRTFADEPSIEHDPWDIEPRGPTYGFFNSFGVSWSWSYTGANIDSVSTERGLGVGLSARLSHPELGAQATYGRVRYSVRGYRAAPWAPRHVFAGRLTGGFGVSDTGAGVGFAVGGLGPQDTFAALQQGVGASTQNVRGYAPGERVGDRFVLANGEYRFPIWDIGSGVQTLPLWLGRVHGAFFLDVGDARSEPFAVPDLLTGVGAELRLSSIVGYYQGVSLRMGVAHGFGGVGDDRVYLVTGSGF